MSKCLGQYPAEHGCGSMYDDMSYYEAGMCYDCPNFGCKDWEKDKCPDCTEKECVYKEV